MCQYCGCYANTHIGRFMDEHVILVNLLGDLGRAIDAEDTGAIGRLCTDMTDLFVVHAEDEETGIFTEMKAEEAYRDKIDALCGEHQSLHDDVAAIRSGDWGRYPNFAQVLREHINAEDNGVFPAANIELDGDAWDRVDARMLANAAQRNS